MNALSILALIAKYLPVVMGTVVAVEQTVHAPGPTKAQVALNTIQTVSQHRRRGGSGGARPGGCQPDQRRGGRVQQDRRVHQGRAGAGAVTPQEITIGISLSPLSSAAVNVYVGLRLAAMQAKMKADTSALEVALVKQFVGWKDEVLAAINGKYVSAKLIAEIRDEPRHGR